MRSSLGIVEVRNHLSLAPIQLTFEQHGFELHMSTYVRISFNKYAISSLYPQVLYPQIQPTTDVEGQRYALMYAMLYMDLSVHRFSYAPGS